MKTYLYFALLIIVVVIGILLLKSQKERAKSTETSRTEKTMSVRSTIKKERPSRENETLEKVKKPEDFTLEDIEKMNEIGKLSKEERDNKPDSMSWADWTYGVFKHRSELANNGKIEFYGKVVDELGEPIKGVTLEAEITANRTSLAEKIKMGKSSKKEKIQLTADKNGMFSLRDKRGKNMIVTDFKKEGYKLIGQTGYKGPFAHKKKYWGYSFNPQSGNLHHPDPNKPVEFVMKKVE